MADEVEIKVFKHVPTATGASFAESSSTASTIMASTSAAATGMPDVSVSASGVNQVINKYMGPVTNNYLTPITPQANTELRRAAPSPRRFPFLNFCPPKLLMIRFQRN